MDFWSLSYINLPSCLLMVMDRKVRRVRCRHGHRSSLCAWVGRICSLHHGHSGSCSMVRVHECICSITDVRAIHRKRSWELLPSWRKIVVRPCASWSYRSVFNWSVFMIRALSIARCGRLYIHYRGRANTSSVSSGHRWSCDDGDMLLRTPVNRFPCQ